MRVFTRLIIKSLGLLIITFSLSSSLFAQSELKGLWVVEKVAMGEREMTPVAKWFDFDGEGSFRSGNGWMQNSSGYYEWNSISAELSVFDSLAIADPYGAFQVSINGNSMRWSREEEGNTVVVTASKSEDLPMAPQDYLVGMWELQTELADQTNPPEHLYFRWDRNVLWWEDGERSRGLWNFNAHQPILLTIVNDSRINWQVEVNEKSLKLKEITEAGDKSSIEYQRIYHFPN